MKQRGFTLIEALIALVVLSIGLVGLAGLLVQGMKFNHNAYIRTQAMLLAYDMADRMLANREGIQSGEYNNVSTTDSTGDPGCATGTICDPAQMAQYDDFAWGQTLAGVLPTGTGTVQGSGAGSIFTISVSWTEIDPNDPDAAADGSVAKTFSMDFQP